MRINASGVYEESGFRFDFTSANGSFIHDKAEPEDGNNVWKGVDFRIFEDGREIWLEVKSWSFKLILERAHRHEARRDFLQKFVQKGTEEFRNDIIAKFLGTTS